MRIYSSSKGSRMYLLIFTLILMVRGTVDCQTSNVWNGIIPLKSTRADVERILGKPEPTSVAQYAGGYNTKTGKVFVLYSTGMCRANPEHGWNIPELTVISVSYYPSQLPKLANLKIDISKFEKRMDPASLSSASYTNEADGIVLIVDTSDDVVESFNYFPESKYRHLMCKNIKTTKSRTAKP